MKNQDEMTKEIQIKSNRRRELFAILLAALAALLPLYPLGWAGLIVMLVIIVLMGDG